MESVRGVTLNLHPEGEAFSDAIRRDKDFYEASILDYIAKNYPVHGTIVDAGANIGNHSAYFANFLQYRQILAFEPVPINYILLALNCANYRAFYPFKMALSSGYHLLQVYPNFSNMGASQVVKETEDGTVLIEALGVPLDMFSLHDCSLIKIDVEHYEPEVIKGAQYTIQRNRPLILIEDGDKKYGKLLPDYELLQSWDEHRTYLYGWKE